MSAAPKTDKGKKRYGYITAPLPPQKAEVYARRALTILAALEKDAPTTLPVFLMANSVLTLSGVRAYDAYHEFYDFMTAKERDAAAKVLRKHDIYMLSGDSVLTDGKTGQSGFELMNRQGLQMVLDSYHFPESQYWPPATSSTFEPEILRFLAWSYAIEHALQDMMAEDTLPSAWLRMGNPGHHIRFGMLLGYPALAIESSIWQMTAHANGAEDLEDAHAQIAYSDAYYAAWPVYDFEPSLVGSPEIQAHEKLWSDILSMVYESDWHKQLKSSTLFIETMATVKKIEDDLTQV